VSLAAVRQRLRLVGPALLLAAAVVVWAVASVNRDRASRVVQASGFIEADQVSIASKIAGRIERIHADEGDAVKAGAVLVALEGKEVVAQLDQATAAVAMARARLAQATAALQLQQAQTEAAVAQAEAALDAARARLPQAEESKTLTESQSTLAILQAEAALRTAEANAAVARANLQRAVDDLARLEPLYKEGAISAQQLDTARSARDAAQAQYDAAQLTVRQADTALALARANARLVGIRGQDVSAAEAQVRQAEAALRNARAGAALVAQRRADVAAAQAQVAQAEATVRLWRAQQENLTIVSPVTGVVLTRHASPGEIVGAGAPILTVAAMDRVWIRLFIPLPQLGRIVVGQTARVTTDALPGRVFTGTVTEISPQAEFTPKNIQTREERVKQVFAVKVTLANPDHLLKPGMPADAVIRAGEGPAAP